MRRLFTFLVACFFALGATAQEGVEEILERNPDEWRRAPEGTWSEWSAEADPPEALQPMFVKAIQAYRIGDMPASLQALFEVLESAPDYPSALHQAGVVYFRLRRYSDSVEAFERYLDVAPQRVGDTRVLAHCYYTLGEYERARAHYEKVLGIHLDSAEARRGLGLALMRLGEPELALEQLYRVLELDPRHANAATWIAQVLFDEERVEEALEAAQQARDLDPFEPRPWFLLSQIYFDLGRDEQGESAQERFSFLNQVAQEIRAQEARLLYDPNQPAVYGRLVSLHRQTGNLMAVGLWLNRWLAVEPGRVSIRIAQLDLALDMGEAEAAVALARNLRRVAGEELRAWERLARYYAERRDRVRQAEAEAEVARLRAGGK
jgi:tetratricopeptide (TPR) repeat protein